MPLRPRPGWKGAAGLSQSVFCRSDEPRNTKAVFGAVRDLVFEMVGRRETPVRFVQAGAHDGSGVLQQHILRRGWRGLLIEPLPGVMQALKANYAGVPGVDFANVAIAPEEGSRVLYTVEGRDQLSSFSLDTIFNHEGKYEDGDLKAAIRTLDVPARPLDALLRETGHDTPHVMVVDTEGYDDVVLGTFDFAAHRPDVVQVEHVHLSRHASASVGDRLTGLGYVLMFDRHDLLALRPDRFDPGVPERCADIVAAARGSAA